MPHRRRQWIKNLLQYGRRSASSPTDGKPPLLWLVDAPRLLSLWGDHLLYRARKDLLDTPPRVIFSPREVYSRHVQMIRPTELRPIRPLTMLRAKWRNWSRWLADGGLEQAIGDLGSGLARGTVAGIGGIAAFSIGIVGGLAGLVAGVLGLTFLGSALGLTRLGERTKQVVDSAERNLREFGHNVGMATLEFTRFRKPSEVLWAFGAFTGMTGMALMLLLYMWPGNLQAVVAENRTAKPHVVHRQPSKPKETPAVTDDMFGGLPDPFGGPVTPVDMPSKPLPVTDPPPTAPVPAADFGDDPFGGFPGELIPTGREELIPIPQPAEPPRAAELESALEHAPLPSDIEAYVPPNVDTPVTATIPALQMLDRAVLPLPADLWEIALPERLPADLTPPPAYEAKALPRPVELPHSANVANRFMPSQRTIAVTIRKTHPTQARSGKLVWYDLVITNRGDEPVKGLIVEERVAEPHRIADAQPAAHHARGKLTWEIAELEPREDVTLKVAVYPMADTPITSEASVRPITSFSAVTMVQEPEPEPEPTPPPVEPVPVAAPTVKPEPVPDGPLRHRRIKLTMTTPETVTRGSECQVRLQVTNTGDVPLSGIVLRGSLPDQLAHPSGADVETALQDLKPGESAQTELTVSAATLGEAELLVEVSAVEGIATAVRGTFDVIRLPVVKPSSEKPAADPGSNTARKPASRTAQKLASLGR